MRRYLQDRAKEFGIDARQSNDKLKELLKDDLYIDNIQWEREIRYFLDKFNETKDVSIQEDIIYELFDFAINTPNNLRRRPEVKRALLSCIVKNSGMLQHGFYYMNRLSNLT